MQTMRLLDGLQSPTNGSSLCRAQWFSSPDIDARSNMQRLRISRPGWQAPAQHQPRHGLHCQPHLWGLPEACRSHAQPPSTWPRGSGDRLPKLHGPTAAGRARAGL